MIKTPSHTNNKSLGTTKLSNIKLQNWAHIALLGAPLLIIILLCIYSVNVPFGDDWAMVGLFREIGTHTLSVTDLLAQHNEHRIFFPRLVMIFSAYLTHWNLQVQMFASFFISIATLALIYLLVKRTYIQTRPEVTILLATGKSLVIFGLMTYLFFSPIQWENWLWGWQVQWFMCIFGAVLAIFLTTIRNIPAKYVGIVLAAIFANYCLSGGMAVWLVVLILLLIQGTRVKYMLGILLSAIASITFYFYHYKKPPGTPSLLTAFHYPLSTLHYFLVYMGNYIGGNSLGLETGFGAILLLAIFPIGREVWIRRKDVSRFAPWLGIMAFSLGAGILITLGRSGFGAGQAASSRYTSMSLLYIIGLLGIIGILVRKSKLWLISLVAICLSLLAASYINGIGGFKSRSTYMHQVKQCTSVASPTQACLMSAYPGIGVSINDLDYIKTKQWGGY